VTQRYPVIERTTTRCRSDVHLDQSEARWREFLNCLAALPVGRVVGCRLALGWLLAGSWLSPRLPQFRSSSGTEGRLFLHRPQPGEAPPPDRVLNRGRCGSATAKHYPSTKGASGTICNRPRHRHFRARAACSSFPLLCVGGVFDHGRPTVRRVRRRRDAAPTKVSSQFVDAYRWAGPPIFRLSSPQHPSQNDNAASAPRAPSPLGFARTPQARPLRPATALQPPPDRGRRGASRRGG